MFYKQYGDTEMRVSAVGFGAMRYSEEDVAADRLDKCAEVAAYAYEQGINYFDTAPLYCEDKSETITGMALSSFKRDSYFLSSKVNFNAIRKLGEGTQINRDSFRRRLETSLTRLKTDYLDFYHLWCILSPEGYKEQCDALYKFFEEAKSEGLIRNIVFSSHMQGAEIEDLISSGLFKGMLIGYNALNYRFRQSGIEAAHKNGMGVVVMNPLGGGLIPSSPDRFAYLQQEGLTVAQSALRFVASHKEITVTLAGITTKSHVDDAVKAVENLQESSAKEIVKKYEGHGASFNDLCTGCGYCKGCPVNLEIPKLMDAYNQKLLSGDETEISDRLLYHWGVPVETAGACISCGKCERQCTQHLPIANRMKEIASLA